MNESDFPEDPQLDMKNIYPPATHFRFQKCLSEGSQKRSKNSKYSENLQGSSDIAVEPARGSIEENNRGSEFKSNEKLPSLDRFYYSAKNGVLRIPPPPKGSEQEITKNIGIFFSTLGKIIKVVRRTRNSLGYRDINNINLIQYSLINDLSNPLQINAEIGHEHTKKVFKS